jgi:hypothetical protein
VGFGLLRQEGWATAPAFVGECRRVRFADEGGRPIMDALPGHAEHGGDIDGGAPPVKFQDGQEPPVCASVRCRLELLTETTAFPVLQFQPAHFNLPMTRDEK